MMLFLTALVLSTNLPLFALSDNLELLSRSLRQLQRSGCQDLALSCPQGTSIFLVAAKYSDVACHGVEPRKDCTLLSSLQYSLLQTTIERCQKKRHCKMPAGSYGPDPCPGVPKHLSITYSCRPYEFRSKTACENEVVQLECGPYFRLAIYSASYGRTQYESLQCPQPQGVPDETCLASYTTEKVIEFCHGKRRCTLSVESKTFEKPCKEESRVYLKVVYTCVAQQVLKYEQITVEEDELQDIAELWPDYDEGGEAAPNTSGHRSLDNGSVTQPEDGGGIPIYPPDEEDTSSGVVQRDLRLQILPSDEDVINCTLNVMTQPKAAIGFLSEWVSTYHFLANNKERLILYLTVSIGGGLLCLLLLLAVRLAWAGRKGPAGDSLPPYVGEFYEGETDIGFGAAHPVDPSEVVRYPTEIESRQYYE